MASRGPISRSSSTGSVVFWLLVLSFSFNLVALVKQGWWAVRLNLWSTAQEQTQFNNLAHEFQHHDQGLLGSGATRLEVYTVHSGGTGGVQLLKIPSPAAQDFTKTKTNSTTITRKASCDDARDVARGVFDGDEFRFTGPCAQSGVSKWYESQAEVCSVLDRFEVIIVGQSTERRVYYGLQAMAGGNEWAFKNGIAEEAEQHIADQKGPLKNLAKRPIPCFHVTLQFETSFAGIAKAIERFVAKGAKNPRRRQVVLFQFGLYGLADNNFHPSQLSKQMDQFLTTSGAAEAARRNGALLVWRPPVPVNATHKRFRRYKSAADPVKDANWSLDRFRKMSNAVAAQHGLCVFDAFGPLMSGVASGAVEFETGAEWTPAQFGGIHLKDNGRKLVCQLLVNVLDFCDKQRPERRGRLRK